jgi:protoheme IX farnesyltransferase
VLIGWAAVTGDLSLAPFVLFAVIFFWTPPHFWALAIRYKDDYAAADVPMLPAVASFRTTARQMLGYTLVVWALSLVFAPVAGLGLLYVAAAVALGAAFTYFAVEVLRTESPKVAMRMFTFSITYLTVLFAAMALDVVVRYGV